MSRVQKSILLLKEAEAPDPYGRVFAEAGFAVDFFAPLRFVPINHERLVSALSEPDQFSGLVVTSPRSAERLREALEEVPAIRAAWSGKSAYATGPRTASMLRAMGFQPRIADHPGGAGVADEIVSDHHDARPLLFPCGTHRREELPEILAAHAVALQQLPVYASRPNPAEALERHPEPDWLAFFSPLGVQVVGSHVRQVWARALRVAIGSTTFEALAEAGIPGHAQADRPNPASLLACVQGYST